MREIMIQILTKKKLLFIKKTLSLENSLLLAKKKLIVKQSQEKALIEIQN